MSRIKSRNTQPERIVRSLLHGAGYRFTVNGPGNRRLPGKPDIVLPKYRTVIFVHGCYWHRHGCKGTTTPKSNTEFWVNKFSRNVENDRKNARRLRRAGWHVIVVWECQLRDPDNVVNRLNRLLQQNLKT